MRFESILAEVDAAGVGQLTLNRPDKRNALTVGLRREISTCLAAWAADPSVGGAVVTGAGPAFCAGYDLDEFRDVALHPEILASSTAYHRDVASFPKPLLAAIHGPAAGGGFDLATLCDLRLCADGAWFSHPELRYGAPPLFTPLRRIVGDGVARDLCLTRRRVPAAEALRIGLVRQVVPAAELLSAARELMREILEAPADALRFAKGRMAAGLDDWLAEEHDRAFREVLLRADRWR